MSDMNFQYFIPTRILFGRGQLSNLHKQQLPGKKALIVTTAGSSVKKYGYLARLQEQLEKAGAAYLVFDKILPNPIKAHVAQGAQLARESHCDFIIGLGGGSSIDAAKAIAVMAANEGDYWDYVSGGTAKGMPVQNDPLPVVAVTTTAGTGTEADPWTVTTNEQTHEKIGFGCDKTFPVLSVVDPDLMMTVPPHLTAYQGFDALFHSTEGYFCKAATAVSDLYAIKSIELIGKSLAAAVNDGSDKKAREDIALANTFSGMVESISSCSSEHSMEHAMSAFHPELPHGAGLIMISRAYYEHFAKLDVCSERMTTMAAALGKRDAACAMDFVTALCELQKACRVDGLKMSDYGIKKEEIEDLAKNAVNAMGGLFAFDPAPLSEQDVADILEASYK